MNALVERTLTPRESRIFRSSAVAHTGHVSPLRNSYSRELYFSALRSAALMACRYADTLKRSSAHYATRAAPPTGSSSLSGPRTADETPLDAGDRTP
jgi:uncharacterized protein YciW